MRLKAGSGRNIGPNVLFNDLGIVEEFNIPYSTHIEPSLPMSPKRVITDDLCNRLYVSSLLRDGNPDYPAVNFKSVYSQLEQALKGRVDIHIIENSKDVWARDFMPIQIFMSRYWNYEYKPDYLERYASQITDWRKTVFMCPSRLDIKPEQPTIVADGGNVVKCDNYVIMTDKIFYEKANVLNRLTHRQIEESMGTEVVVIPRDPEDPYGHADGMVRFLSPRRVIFRAAQDKADEVFMSKVKSEFHRQKPDVEIEQFDFHEIECQNKYNWCYINFLRIGRIVLLPLLNGRRYIRDDDFVFEDYFALTQLSKLLPECEIIGINMGDVIRYGGGGLNCLSWTVYDPT